MTRTISKGSRRSGAEFAEATDRDARIQKALEALAAGHYNQYPNKAAAAAADFDINIVTLFRRKRRGLTRAEA